VIDRRGRRDELRDILSDVVHADIHLGTRHEPAASQRPNANRLRPTTSSDVVINDSALRGIHQDEVVPVGHRDLRQRARVHLVGVADDAVEVQQVRGDRVHLVVGE
jgi:hypothetical protein